MPAKAQYPRKVKLSSVEASLSRHCFWSHSCEDRNLVGAMELKQINDFFSTTKQLDPASSAG